VVVKNLIVLLYVNQHYTGMKRFFTLPRMTLILSPARHSERTHLCGSEESSCATGCKLKFHKHEKILLRSAHQNDGKR
ncbi:MAG: hypothetical protein N4A43_00665, partial [Alphaproteobacteria bacterium]|nr:hypothetical protein [Alphaproteobacteria bacterium]